MLYAILMWLLLGLAAGGPDTVVVCPADFRPGLIDWELHRRAQGHEILVIEPTLEAAELKTQIQLLAQTGRLRHVLLIGNVPSSQRELPSSHTQCVPTHYLPAAINTRWGSEPTIPSDTPYADIDGDGVPDLSVGRIAASSAEQLAAVVSKVLQYEAAEPGEWQRRLNVVSGVGGFGPVADAVIEAAGRHVIQQSVPKEYMLIHTPLNPQTTRVPREQFRSQMRSQFEEGSMAWIYLGHGLPHRLDNVRTTDGNEPILSVRDVAELRCGACSPLTVLMACYAGAFDAARACLGEELSLAANGPIAVIAATRVTMPYGNTVLGYELLRACFEEEKPTLGEILLLAQQRCQQEAPDDAMRASLDAICRGLSPPPNDPAAERAEHVLMYHLLGDPLLRLRRAPIGLKPVEAM